MSPGSVPGYGKKKHITSYISLDIHCPSFDIMHSSIPKYRYTHTSIHNITSNSEALEDKNMLKQKNCWVAGQLGAEQ